MKFFRLVFLFAAVLLSSVIEAKELINFEVPVKISNSLATGATVDCTVYQGSVAVTARATPLSGVIKLNHGNFDGVVHVQVVTAPTFQALTGRETYSCKLLLRGTNGVRSEPSEQSPDPALKAKPGTPLKTTVSGNL
jgi:hypothetical protein